MAATEDENPKLEELKDKLLEFYNGEFKEKNRDSIKSLALHAARELRTLNSHPTEDMSEDDYEVAITVPFSEDGTVTFKGKPMLLSLTLSAQAVENFSELKTRMNNLLNPGSTNRAQSMAIERIWDIAKESPTDRVNVASNIMREFCTQHHKLMSDALIEAGGREALELSSLEKQGPKSLQEKPGVKVKDLGFFEKLGVIVGRGLDKLFGSGSGRLT